MPQLPRYDSQQNISAQPATPMLSGAGAEEENLGKAVDQVGAIATKWGEALDTIQLNQGKALYLSEVSELKNRAITDPDINATDKYFKELKKIQDRAVSGIQNKTVQSMAAMEFGTDTAVAQLEIGNIFKKKQIIVGQAAFQTEMGELQKQRLAASGNTALMAAYELKINESMDRNIRSGIIDAKDAQKYKTDTEKLAVQYEIYNDPATKENESVVLEQLKLGDKGKYSFLSPEVRLDMIQESQRRIFQNNQTYKREAEITRDSRFNNLFDKMLEGTDTLADIDAELEIPEEQGGIPKKQLLEMKKKIQDRTKTDLEIIVEDIPKAKVYLDAIDDFVLDETDRQKGREYLAKAYADGILSPKEASFLNKLKRETEDIEFSRTSIPRVKGAVNAVREVMRGRKTSTEQDAALAIKQLIAGLSEGKNTKEVIKEVLYQSAIKKNPILLNIPKDGQLSYDEEGNIKIVMPDLEVKVAK